MPLRLTALLYDPCQLALKVAKVYKPSALQINKIELTVGSERHMEHDHGEGRMLWTGLCEYCTSRGTASTPA